jgi:hypothetical protein
MRQGSHLRIVCLPDSPAGRGPRHSELVPAGFQFARLRLGRFAAHAVLLHAIDRRNVGKVLAQFRPPPPATLVANRDRQRLPLADQHDKALAARPSVSDKLPPT